MFIDNKKVSLDCDFIISYNLTWKEAKERFSLNEGNIQRVYIRYIIVKYGIKRAQILLSDSD